MHTQKKNDHNDAVAALEEALRLIETKSLQIAEAGAAVWVKPDGSSICVRISPEDCLKIPGMVFVGGTCSEAIKQFLKQK